MTLQTFNLILSATIGACWGSFLNAAYYRTVSGISLSNPPSHCPDCKKAIPMWLNLPVIGWLLCLGKCFNCKKPINIHYPAFEALVGLFFLLICMWVKDATTACFLGGLFSLYGFGALYDYKYLHIPSLSLYGSIIFAGIISYMSPSTFVPGLVGIQGSLCLVYGSCFLVSCLLIIKYGSAPFFKSKLPLGVGELAPGGGRGIVTEQGITIVEADGKAEFTSWHDCGFSKIIPMGNVRITDGYTEVQLKDGELEILDGAVRVKGELTKLKPDLVFLAEHMMLYRNTMGDGDIWLVGSLGMIVGFNMSLLDFFLVSYGSSLIPGLYSKYVKGGDGRVPFGPFLILGAMYVLASRYKIVPIVYTLLQH